MKDLKEKCLQIRAETNKFNVAAHYLLKQDDEVKNAIIKETEKYPIDYKNIVSRINVILDGVKPCANCGKEHYIHDKYCSKQCYLELKTKQSLEKAPVLRQKKIDTVAAKGGVWCKACDNFCAMDLSQHIKNVHGMTNDEYRSKYNANVWAESLIKTASDRVKGDKNPAYQHGGKFSSLSDKFIGYNNLSEEQIKERKAKVGNNISISHRENGNTPTQLLYWTKKGYTLDEAKKLQKNRQITFSFDTCVHKYGEEDGNKRFIERQEKWQNTLNAKTIEEITKINQGKSTGRMNQLFNSNPEIKKIPGILYYVRFFNNDGFEFFKIGITSQTDVNKRFGCTHKYGLKYETIWVNTALSFYECFKKEQEILKQFKEYRINIDYRGFTTTEAFSKNVLNE